MSISMENLIWIGEGNFVTRLVDRGWFHGDINETKRNGTEFLLRNGTKGR